MLSQAEANTLSSQVELGSDCGPKEENTNYVVTIEVSIVYKEGSSILCALVCSCGLKSIRSGGARALLVT